MKKLILIALLALSANTFAQTDQEFKWHVSEVRENGVI